MPNINQTLDPALLNWMGEAKDEYLTCRDVKHNWPRRRPKWVLSRDPRLGFNVLMRFMQCGDCGYSKTERMDPDTYELYPAITEYPRDDNGKVGYLLPPGVGRLSRADLLQYEALTQNGGIREVKNPPVARRRSTKRK